jgi:DNA replication and repair protein RecF
MIKHIKLTNFRKFKNLELDITHPIIILHGDNAQGKSTILESIYILTNGHSPWASSDEYVNNTQEDKNQHTRIEMTTDDHTYSYFKDSRKKTVQIDGSNTTPKKFHSLNSATIFNPEQIEILMISPAKRRAFIDDIIAEIDYEYTDTLKRFRKVLRQRNAYLKKLAKKFYEKGIIARNDPQLNFWSNEFIQLATDIRKKREDLIKEMKTGIFHLEYEIQKGEDEDIEKALENSKKRDIATGYTNIGPHRDDWQIFNGKNIKKFGSRGEKRLAIGELIFQSQEILKKELGFYPILLLDDIASELDSNNTLKIFRKEILDKQQTFITIIDKNELPKEVLENSQHIDLNKIS